MACCLTVVSHFLTIVDLSSVGSCSIHLQAISEEMSKISVLDMSTKITGTNGLRYEPNFVLLCFVVVKLLLLTGFLWCLNLYSSELQIQGTGTSIWLPQCQWSNPEEYGKNRLIPNHHWIQQNANLFIVNGVHCVTECRSWWYATIWLISHVMLKIKCYHFENCFIIGYIGLYYVNNDILHFSHCINVIATSDNFIVWKEFLFETYLGWFTLDFLLWVSFYNYILLIGWWLVTEKATICYTEIHKYNK